MHISVQSSFDLAVIFDQPVLFSDERISRENLPDNIHVYELQYDEHDVSTPSHIEDHVQNHFYGTVMSKDTIDLTNGQIPTANAVMNSPCRSISPDDFRIDDMSCATISEYLAGRFEVTPLPEKQIRVLIVKPLESPQETVIPNTLEAKQKIVDGLIEAIYPFEDTVALICNEEGKLIGLPLNRQVGQDIIAGNFIVCGIDDRNASFSSLSNEQMKKYKAMFRPIEMYMGSMYRSKADPVKPKKDYPER